MKTALKVTLIVVAAVVATIGLFAMRLVLAFKSEEMNSAALLMASVGAHAAGRTEDAEFFLYASQMRSKIDRQVYPKVDSRGVAPAPKDTDPTQEPPELAVHRFRYKDPQMLENVIARLEKWSPEFSRGYNPGWRYENALADNAAAGIVATVRTETLAPLRQLHKLMSNREFAKWCRQADEAAATTKRIRDEGDKRGQPLRVLPEFLTEYDAAVAKGLEASEHLRELKWELLPETRWHARFGWKAEDYFDDQQVIALCQAIEADDVEEMERLIAAGADANATGKKGMTPLLWAFPDRKLERFRCLLEQGADPNVFFGSSFGVPQHASFQSMAVPGFGRTGCRPGQSVTHLAARCDLPEYFHLVMAHGGDPNLLDRNTGEAPLDLVIDRTLHDGRERVQVLIDKGADLNRYCKYRRKYPTMAAVQADRFDIALDLLKAGADPTLYQPDDIYKLIHVLNRQQRNAQYFQGEHAEQNRALIAWLAEHGETLEQAQEDEARWKERFAKSSSRGRSRVTYEIIQDRNAKQQPSE